MWRVTVALTKAQQFCTQWKKVVDGNCSTAFTTE
jgi:hypothetical protein